MGTIGLTHSHLEKLRGLAMETLGSLPSVMASDRFGLGPRLCSTTSGTAFSWKAVIIHLRNMEVKGLKRRIHFERGFGTCCPYILIWIPKIAEEAPLWRQAC